MRLTLLRGTTAPDPMADYGEHNFKYSLYPHVGSWDEKTIAHAYALNDPVIVYESQVAGRRSQDSGNSLQVASDKLSISINQSLVTTNQPNVIIETIKRAEDGNGIIVRLYESQRQRGTLTLTTAFDLETAWRTNILEENQVEIGVDGNQLHHQIKPYQILTLRLVEMK
jgi:alpha-mannosidase